MFSYLDSDNHNSGLQGRGYPSFLLNLRLYFHEMREDQSNKKPQKIDIREVFRSKNPGLAPYIPGFVYSYLERILHLDFINKILEDHGNKKDLDFVNAIKDEFNITTEIIGFENIPENKKLIVVANHPLGGFDGTMLISLLGEKFAGVKSLTNDILMNIPNMEGVFVAVNKHGKQSKDGARIIDNVYKSMDPILIFPAGLVSRRKRGIIRDLEWKKSFITKAKAYQRDVIPVHVSGRCTNFFYNLSNLRKFFGIKANLEMFFLADETYRHRNEHIRIVLGKPVSFETYTTKLRPDEWALKMKELVYRLEKDPNAFLE